MQGNSNISNNESSESIFADRRKTKPSLIINSAVIFLDPSKNDNPQNQEEDKQVENSVTCSIFDTYYGVSPLYEFSFSPSWVLFHFLTYLLH